MTNPTNAAPIQLICPNLRCRKFQTTAAENRGKLIKCGCCNTTFRLPEKK